MLFHCPKWFLFNPEPSEVCHAVGDGGGKGREQLDGLGGTDVGRKQIYDDGLGRVRPVSVGAHA